MPAPANKSLRLLLLEAVGKHLFNTIKIANGYTHDLTQDNIRIGAQFMPTGTPGPYVCVFEKINRNPDEGMTGVQKVGGGASDSQLAYPVRFDVSGYSKSSDPYSPASETYELMADVKKAFGLLDQIIQENDGLFYGVTINRAAHDPGAILPQSTVEQKTLNAMFVVQLSIQIVESAADPYRLTD